MPAARPRQKDRLTAREVQTASRPGRYPDGNGLVLEISQSGTKAWRYRFRLHGKEGIYTIGRYPDISLAKARAAAEDARALVAAERSPVHHRQAEARTTAAARIAEAVTLGHVAELWFAAAEAEGVWSTSHAEKTRGRIDNHLAPTALWKMPIAEIRVSDLAALLDRLHAAKPDTCKKVRMILSGTFRYAAARELVNGDPVAVTRPGSGMRRKKLTRNLAAVTELNELGDVLRRIELATASWQVKAALRLMAYSAQRPGRVIAARWDEFILEPREGARWTIPRELQKNSDVGRPDHVVPLAGEVVDWLLTLPRSGSFLFPSDLTDSGHITVNAPSKLLNRGLRLKGIHTPHGFRASFSTIANSTDRADGTRRFDRDDIEHVLDHEIRSETALAYDRRRALPRLRAILEWWGETLTAARRRT